MDNHSHGRVTRAYGGDLSVMVDNMTRLKNPGTREPFLSLCHREDISMKKTRVNLTVMDRRKAS